LTPSVTETLFALGRGTAVVGVSRYCDYPPAVAALPKVGSFLTPVVEAVAALEPTLVLTSPSPGNREPVSALERVGVRVVAVPEGSGSIAEVLAAIGAVAAAVGAVDEASRLVEAINAELAQVEARVRNRPVVPAAIVVGRDPLVLAGPDSYLGDLLRRVGGANVAQDIGGKWPRMGLEYLVQAAPHVIVDLGMGSEREADRGRWARLEGVPAVRDGRVHFDNTSVLLHPGPRLGRQALLLARLLHPDAWPESENITPD
jgi:iron complex transport system substrate-binding protein